MSTGLTGGYTYLPQGQTIYNASDLCHNMLPTFQYQDGTTAGRQITGVVYAIQAYGGFQTTRTFDNITRLPETLIAQFDTTGALEVVIPCQAFNSKIGITKVHGQVINDSSRPYYDISNNMLYTDALTLSNQEFVNYMRADVSAAIPGNANYQVVSVGTFSTLYTDFNLYIAQYFGFANGNFPAGSEWGFGTLFSGELQFASMQANNGVFDASAFVQLLRKDAWSDASGGYQTPLTGSLTVAGITQLLRNAVDADPFNNRNPNSPYISSDMHDVRDYGVTDGFYPNDLFFIPNNGFQISLEVNIDQEAFSNPLNNVNSEGYTGGPYGVGAATSRADNPNNSNPTLANTVGNVGDLSNNLPSDDGQGFNFLTNTGSTTTTSANAGTGIATTTRITSARTVSTTLLQRVVQAPLLVRLGESSWSQFGNGSPVDVSLGFLTTQNIAHTGATSYYYNAQSVMGGGPEMIGNPITPGP